MLQYGFTLYCFAALFPLRKKQLKVLMASEVYLWYNHHLSFIHSELFTSLLSPFILNVAITTVHSHKQLGQFNI